MKIVDKERKERKTKKRSLHPCSELLAQFIIHTYRGLPANTVLTREELIQDCSDMLHFRFGGLPLTLIEDAIARLYDVITTTEYLVSKPVQKHLDDAVVSLLGKPFHEELKLAVYAVKKGLPKGNIRDDIWEMALRRK